MSAGRETEGAGMAPEIRVALTKVEAQKLALQGLGELPEARQKGAFADLLGT